MFISNDFGNVRVVHDGDPFKGDDIRVECLKDGVWTLYSGFNTLSDDYAITNSREAAARAIKFMEAESQ